MKLRTLTEAAKILGVSRYHLRAGIAAGRYPVFAWGNRQLVDVEALAEIIAEERRQQEAREGMIGLRECAEAIGIAPEALRRMAVAGLVPHERRGRYYRFRLADVESAIRGNMK